ncbi:MAG: hypothetical protein JW818_06260 [Pirellulales bacterium]|nr:hypothetical protein [Pirellulales bacterium]
MMRFLAAHLALSLVFAVIVSAKGNESAPRGVGQWPAELGNHRAVVKVEAPADAVRVHLPWRRPDRDPEKKAVVVVDAATGKQIDNVVTIAVNREYGDLAFQPVSGPGTYHVYYLPAQPVRTGNFRKVAYAKPRQTADKQWRERNGLSSAALKQGRWRALPEARLVEFQARSSFDQFVEMERIATRAETQALLGKYPAATYLLFPESRRRPIRMADDLPQCWMERGPDDTFEDKARPGEFFTWQIGVFSARHAIEDMEVAFEDLRSTSGSSAIIPASAIRCFNKGGVDWRGNRFTQSFVVDRGKVRALWFGAAVPRDLPPGRYEGNVTLTPKGLAATKVRLCLEVAGDVLEDAGDSEPWRHSRLRWLDSTIGLDDEPVTPYTPLEVEGNTIRCLGRQITLGASGLPKSIQSFFVPEVTRLTERGREILAAPIQFVVEFPDRKTLPFSGGNVEFTQRTDGVVAWRSTSTAGGLTLACGGRIEPDGYVEFRLRLTTNRLIDVKDLRLLIPMREDVARYMMGLGRPGGFRPAQFQWKWDPSKHQDRVWVGDVNAGLQCRWYGENYVRPVVGPYYAERPLNMPPAWHNGGQGSVTIGEQDDRCVMLQADTGTRTFRPGQILHFYFNLLLTPFHPIDTDGHWARRYHHRYRWPSRGEDDLRPVADGGANVLNIHQGNGLNPYINYPFLTVAPLTQFVRRAHESGIQVKLYYTVREITTHLPELWAFRSLGHELLAAGKGGGAPWLQEHLVDDYRPAWYDAPVSDASILTRGMSRLHNFYLEGLDWLVRNVQIDGLYLDEIAYDRTVMKRVRKVLKRSRPDGLIDFHSWNHFCPEAGFACCLNMYMEHLPYIDRVFIGESRDYSLPPDYWLIEISGIPFGVMGDMLQSGGNPWRGMVFGMTNRWGWGGDPRAIWTLWDEFGLQGSQMIGYWSPRCPVATDQKDVLATVYRRPDRALVAVASWAPERAEVKLKIDWKSLGMDASKTRLRAPAVDAFQPAAVFKPTDKIPIEPGRGWLLILEPAPR